MNAQRHPVTLAYRIRIMPYNKLGHASYHSNPLELSVMEMTLLREVVALKCQK